MSAPSSRVGGLPSYAVSEIVAAKRRLMQAGVDVIDLGAGDADFPPPEAAVEAMQEALRDPRMSRYGFQQGLIAFREAAAHYMERRFGVTLDPMEEILPLIGSKEGLAHLPFAVLDEGQTVVVPEPGYPAYIGGAVLSGAEAEIVPLVPAKRFLVELEDLPHGRLERVGLAYLNYPNNPTAAVAPLDYLERTVELCRRRKIVIAYDNPYCEITFDGYRAPSIFQVGGARDVAIEFHSLSKTFGMTGWRLGWAAGSRQLIGALTKVKSYVDTGPFLAIQHAGAAVLERAEAIVPPLVDAFRRRRDAAVKGFRQAGFDVESPRATMYLWIPVPGGIPSAEFARQLLETEGVLLLHGSAFGAGGEGFFRVALTVAEQRLEEAAERTGRMVERAGIARGAVAVK
ncbi:MAG TPA: aminotransferase class I/II-fold pyridoxal phosphate-dependent enzyme [Gemmatimonadales bacterium]|nr:aminotransferase class I/II-fold pyridoxal phosphate-dependent enzyme [Gemmatimonadales bacterium]